MRVIFLVFIYNFEINIVGKKRFILCFEMKKDVLVEDSFFLFDSGRYGENGRLIIVLD